MIYKYPSSFTSAVPLHNLHTLDESGIIGNQVYPLSQVAVRWRDGLPSCQRAWVRSPGIAATGLADRISLLAS